MLRRCVLSGLILAAFLAFSAPAAARSVTVTLHSDPPGAEVWLLGAYSAAPDHRDVPLGRADVPLTVDTRAMLPRAAYEFRFQLPGYDAEQVRLAWDAARPDPLESRIVRLRPAGLAASLADAWRRSPRTVVAGALAGAVIVLGAVAFVRRRVAEERALVQAAHLHDDLMLTGHEADPLLGCRMGRWRLVAKLGSGGMAVVYRALPEGGSGDEDARAVKVISQELSEDAEFRRRFERECKLCGALTHPALVRVEAWGAHEGRMYLVMELVKGRTLRALIPPGGLPLADALALMRPVLQGVGEAHRHGIVHRDLKPENVMCDGGPSSVRVMDFGLARDEKSSRLTATGTVLGTPAYVAPEQITQAELDPRADQYSLGVMLFELLAGQPPFSDEDPSAVIMKHLAVQPPGIRELRPDLPPALEAVLARMLEKEPKRRYESVDDALAALEAAAGE